jgi:hypothetical protein
MGNTPAQAASDYQSYLPVAIALTRSTGVQPNWPCPFPERLPVPFAKVDSMTQSTTTLQQTRQALARSIGQAAFVYGYPLTETYRTCACRPPSRRGCAPAARPARMCARP